MRGGSREIIKSFFPFLTSVVRWIKKRKNELFALKRHIIRKKAQKNNCHVNGGKIRVVFICQFIPAWSKNKQLFKALKSDNRFEVLLLCIPNRISANRLIDPDDLSNDVYDYFREHGYNEAVNALIGKDEWLDIRQMYPDYVIYNRYDRSMPTQYTSSVVSTYAKICFIAYASAMLKGFEMDKQFVANTYCLFAENNEKKEEFISWNRILCSLKLSRAVCCGIPAIENAYKARNDKSIAWDFSKNDFRIIYAPRWTTEPLYGGSSFAEYKDVFLEFADKYPQVDVLVRPHPFMFDNFVKTGAMTTDEVNLYIQNCDERQNIQIDNEKEYLASFWNSSVLICDFSSMIIEYLVTGKPIIYLTYDERVRYNEQMLDIISCSYIVNNADELESVIQKLIAGNDQLANKRAELCNKLTSNNVVEVSKNIKQELINGYKK